MQRLGLAAVAGAVVVLLAMPQARGRQASAFVLEDVTLIDGTGAPPQPSTTIVVRGDRIADVFPAGAREIPADSTRLDVAGAYVLPGLIDTHVHLALTERPPALVAALLRATLLGGVTTVRDMGGGGATLARLRDAARDPSTPSPEIRAAAVFAGPTAFWFVGDPRVPYFSAGFEPGTAPWLVRVDERTDLRDAVARATAWGAAGIVVHADLTRGQVDDIASEARRRQLPAWSEATIGPPAPRDVVDVRVTSLSGATQLVWQGPTGLLPPLYGRAAGVAQAIERVPPDHPAIDDLLRRMRDRRVMLEPTLFITVQAAALAGDDGAAYDRQAAWAAAVTQRAHEAGVTILAGTDAIGGSSPNLHVELQLLVERAGLTPLEAIRAATFDAARALGVAGEIGSVVVGRRADLVVLDANPADDIRNTQTIRFVMRAGVVHELPAPMPVPPLARPPDRP